MGARTRTTMEPLRIDQVKSIVPQGKDSYEIYQFPEGTLCSSDGELEAAISAQGIDTLKKIDRSALLSQVAPWGFIPGQLHFVIVPPDQDEEDTLESLPFSVRRWTYFRRTPAKAPSSEAQASEFDLAQRSEAHRIYCGRPYQRSTPPSLLDETLCQLRCNLDSIIPDPKDIQCFASLRAYACENLTEDERRETFTNILERGNITPVRAKRGFIGASRYHDDGDLRVHCLDVDVIYYVQVIKREIGNTSGDPYVEAIHYWIENVREFFCSRSCENNQVERLNFPAVLVLHLGPFLAIAAAVYGDDPIVELLCCIPLHIHDTHDSQLQAGERALAALRVALHSLRDRYSNIVDERVPRADFPFRDYYKDSDHNVHSFTYERDIDKKRVFRVIDKNGTPLCVKFSKRFAPALRAVNKVHDWIMIVMEDKTAQYSNTMWDVKHRKDAPEKGKGKGKEKAKPAVSMEAALEQVRTKLGVLHDGGFVHGDLRDVNVLLRNDDAPADCPDILLIDWDWAGVAGKVVYPRGINTQLRRPDGALAAEEIKAEHDVWMVNNLLE
ncbi:hypothetical protein L226DRAFT_614727 [Lentinus tigrinus ALCF2SS1-7]|uniref:Protein kinase domain-containing protein n=1 Tax=Lentinus tigrinus ALCF2SS1-6 TaxID=1328759 RepID=A0A5C2RWH8_9APHY|nr:hypothetical protein L227DRAFT_656793 [Lentinus tigrinus ALCF2SS1-6]RPD72531.1 hypothetical protein L226DRAFT_614727 [Lentinus tigrinus ALCF2SS1-7]